MNSIELTKQQMLMISIALISKAADLQLIACGRSSADESKRLRAEADKYEALANEKFKVYQT